MADHADELRLVVHCNPHDEDGETSVRAKDFPRRVRHDMQAQVAYKGIVIGGEGWLSRGHHGTFGSEKERQIVRPSWRW